MVLLAPVSRIWMTAQSYGQVPQRGTWVNYSGPRAGRLAINCTLSANINNMLVSLSWLKVVERLTASLLVVVRGIDKLKAQAICLND